MLVITTNNIMDKELEMLGLVKGSVVQSKHFGNDIVAAFKNFVGGEIDEYTSMMNEAREIATQRMVMDAQRMGADAIIGMRYATSSIMQAASEICAYGTAVKFK